MAIIDFDNVNYSYGNGTPALAGVELHIKQGEFVCILGANGSGKTTLTRHINALLVPDEGTVRVLGHNTLDQERLVEIRSNVGMVFQNPDDQIVASLVEDDVAFGPHNLGISGDELGDRVREALACVDLTGFEKREVAHLSGGEKQRVAIAGALAMRPKVLVLDEATALLDPHGRKRLLDICRELNESGLTIVLVTHLLDEVAFASRVIILDEGRIEIDGSADEALGDDDRLRALGLSAPFERQPRTQNNLKSASQDNPDRDAVITLQDVSFSYHPQQSHRTHRTNRIGRQSEPCESDEQHWALRQVTLSLYAGDILGIAGHSGSGKSTLLRLAGGLASPTRGHISFQQANREPKRGSLDSRINVGIVFQHPEQQLFAATVFDDVAFGPRNLGLPIEEIDKCVRQALEQVGLDLDELRDRSPFSLSGGQQRRVAIAGVLACRPTALIMDEPTAGLDPRARKSLLELVDRLNYEQGMPVMIASHNVNDLTDLCDRIVVLERGEIRETLEGYSKSYKSLAALLNA